MTLIGSPSPTSESHAPRIVCALAALVVMLGVTLLFLAALVAATGGDPHAGLTYQLALWWTLLATIGAVAGSAILAKRYAPRLGAWKGALRGALVATGLAVAGNVVGYGLLAAIYRFTGA